MSTSTSHLYSLEETKRYTASVPLTNVQRGIVCLRKVVYVGYPKGLDGNRPDSSQQLGDDHHCPYAVGLLLRILRGVRAHKLVLCIAEFSLDLALVT